MSPDDGWLRWWLVPGVRWLHAIQYFAASRHDYINNSSSPGSCQPIVCSTLYTVLSNLPALIEQLHPLSQICDDGRSSNFVYKYYTSGDVNTCWEKRINNQRIYFWFLFSVSDLNNIEFNSCYCTSHKFQYQECLENIYKLAFVWCCTGLVLTVRASILTVLLLITIKITILLQKQSCQRSNSKRFYEHQWRERDYKI